MQKLVIGFHTISAKKEGGILLRHLGRFAVAAKVSLGTASRTELGRDCLTHVPREGDVVATKLCWSERDCDGENDIVL